MSVACFDKVFLVNTDDINQIGYSGKEQAYIITYGLGNKATITVSSIEEDYIVLCLQRSIVTLDMTLIEPQEFSVRLTKKYDIETIMLITSICLISGVPINKLSKFVF